MSPAPQIICLQYAEKIFKNVKKILSVLSFILISALFFAGCSQNESGTPFFEYDYYGVMNTDAALKIYVEEDGEEQELKFKELAERVKILLSDIENSLSAEVENSSVFNFNAAAAGERVEVNLYAYETLSIAKSVYELTGGAYNPAVYYSVKAYGFNGGEPPKSAEDLPADENILKYVGLSKGFADIELTEENGKFYAVKPENTATVDGKELSLKIDLGGIGKGYAVDRVNGLIEEYGYKYGYFSFGSSSIAFKEYPDESLEYNLKLSNPRKNGNSPQSYLTTAVKDECVSSSGDNENYYLLDSDGDGVVERFCHIIDSFTGKPVQTGVIAATVIGGSAAENDALTTAIMAMGREKAVEFINSLQGRRAVFVCEEDGAFAVYTNMASDKFTVDDSRFKAGLPSDGGLNVA